MFDDFYRNKRVLVTGHTGFKGSWLALWLHALGADVTGFALKPNTSPSHFELVGLGNLINNVEGDIRDYALFGKIVREVRPEIVFHLAAQALVRESYDNPKETFDINIGGTVNILEAVRESASIRSIVVVTSDKCYENREWVWGYRESDPVGGYDPYSASKGATEIVCSAYLRSFFSGRERKGPALPVGLATARAGNVIGGGDWAMDRIIPDCIRALSKDEPILIRNPDAVRPWQHVLEPLSGYLLLGKRLFEDPARFSGAWNFGPADSEYVTVRFLAQRFIEIWGKGSMEITHPREPAPHEAYLLRLAIDKAVHNLKWRPLLNNSEALDWTVEWYRAWLTCAKEPRDTSMGQITLYIKDGAEKMYPDPFSDKTNIGVI